MDENPYEILGVALDATEEEIKQAYRKRALIVHPDAGGTVEDFRMLSMAFSILSDAEEREHFDRTGRTSVKMTEVESQIASMLLDAFDCDDNRDPIMYMKDRIDRIRGEHRQRAAAHKKKIKRIEKQIKRFEKHNAKTPNKTGRDLIVTSLSNSLSTFRKMVQECEEKAELGDRMLEYLNDLECPAANPHSFQSSRSPLVFSGWTTGA